GREKHVADHRQFGLEPPGHQLASGFQRVDASDDVACVGEQQHAFGGELRKARGPIEQRYTELALQAADPATHCGLHTIELAPCGRKTAFVDRCNENPELIEGYTVQHCYPSQI